jgi:hypothetical protein
LKRLAFVFLSAAMALGACQKAPKSSETGPYAGLSTAIATWHKDIQASLGCAAKPASGHGCQNFNIECKASLDLEPGKSGETARIVAGMSWDAWSAKRSDYDSASGGAIFAKTNGVWARQDLSGPINLATCVAS